MITNEEFWVTLHKLYKYVLDEDSIITVVLKGHLLIENHIDSLLNTVLVEPSVLDLCRMYLPQKLDILVAVGVISKADAIAYRKFNQMRSKFAHNIDYELTNEDIRVIVESFTAKHKILFKKSEFDKETNTINRLKTVIQPLLYLLIFQNAVDEVGEKSPHQQLDVADIERTIKNARENNDY